MFKKIEVEVETREYLEVLYKAIEEDSLKHGKESLMDRKGKEKLRLNRLSKSGKILYKFRKEKMEQRVSQTQKSCTGFAPAIYGDGKMQVNRLYLLQSAKILRR